VRAATEEAGLHGCGWMLGHVWAAGVCKGACGVNGREGATAEGHRGSRAVQTDAGPCVGRRGLQGRVRCERSRGRERACPPGHATQGHGRRVRGHGGGRGERGGCGGPRGARHGARTAGESTHQRGRRMSG
jgi:hypothetical protein